MFLDSVVRFRYGFGCGKDAVETDQYKNIKSLIEKEWSEKNKKQNNAKTYKIPNSLVNNIGGGVFFYFLCGTTLGCHTNSTRVTSRSNTYFFLRNSISNSALVEFYFQKKTKFEFEFLFLVPDKRCDMRPK